MKELEEKIAQLQAQIEVLQIERKHLLRLLECKSIKTDAKLDDRSFSRMVVTDDTITFFNTGEGKNGDNEQD